MFVEMPELKTGPVGDRRLMARPLPTAIAAACISAAILLTLGGLSMVSTRQVMQRDAGEIFAAGAVAAAGGLHSDVFSASHTAGPLRDQAREESDRAVRTVMLALPDAALVQVGSVRGDSMT